MFFGHKPKKRDDNPTVISKNRKTLKKIDMEHFSKISDHVICAEIIPFLTLQEVINFSLSSLYNKKLANTSITWKVFFHLHMPKLKISYNEKEGAHLKVFFRKILNSYLIFGAKSTMKPSGLTRRAVKTFAENTKDKYREIKFFDAVYWRRSYIVCRKWNKKGFSGPEANSWEFEFKTNNECDKIFSIGIVNKSFVDTKGIHGYSFYDNRAGNENRHRWYLVQFKTTERVHYQNTRVRETNWIAKYTVMSKMDIITREVIGELKSPITDITMFRMRIDTRKNKFQLFCNYRLIHEFDIEKKGEYFPIIVCESNLLKDSFILHDQFSEGFQKRSLKNIKYSPNGYAWTGWFGLTNVFGVCNFYY